MCHSYIQSATTLSDIHTPSRSLYPVRLRRRIKERKKEREGEKNELCQVLNPGHVY